MSGRRARAIRRQVYGHHEHSFRPEARGVKFLQRLGGTLSASKVTQDERRTAYQHAKREWKRQGAPGPLPLRDNRRRGRVAYWETEMRRLAAWRKKQ